MEEKRIYKYRLDFYYKSLIVYFLFFIVYVAIKGNFFEEKFEIVFQDPIIYICMLFIFYMFVTCILYVFYMCCICILYVFIRMYTQVEKLSIYQTKSNSIVVYLRGRRPKRPKMKPNSLIHKTIHNITFK